MLERSCVMCTNNSHDNLIGICNDKYMFKEHVFVVLKVCLKSYLSWIFEGLFTRGQLKDTIPTLPPEKKT